MTGHTHNPRTTAALTIDNSLALKHLEVNQLLQRNQRAHVTRGHTGPGTAGKTSGPGCGAARPVHKRAALRGLCLWKGLRPGWALAENESGKASWVKVRMSSGPCCWDPSPGSCNLSPSGFLKPSATATFTAGPLLLYMLVTEAPSMPLPLDDEHPEEGSGFTHRWALRTWEEELRQNGPWNVLFSLLSPYYTQRASGAWTQSHSSLCH